MSPRLLPVLILGLALTRIAGAGPVRWVSAEGIGAAFDPQTGDYAVSSAPLGWTFAGSLGRPTGPATVRAGSDSAGPYHEIAFAQDAPGGPAGAMRVYDARPAVLLTLELPDGAAALPMPFPDFTEIPRGLHPFSYQEKVFAPPSFAPEQNGTPWLLFDDRGRAAIISPAANFMVARMEGDAVHEIASALNPGVRDLPRGFAHRTLIAFGDGINATWDSWGRALTAIQGKVRPANDADVGLRDLGYWTDNGATYYYRYDPALGYAGTLESLVAHERARGVPIRYLQLDSWWYEKSLTGPDGKVGEPKNPRLPAGEWNRYGGLLEYRADPAVLPDGLGGFAEKVGLPLITHNRWIDPASPYHGRYAISGLGAIDPRWWRDIMDYLSAAGVVCYEQDWLSTIYDRSPAFSSTLGDAGAFTDAMALAAKARGMSVQYCMIYPRYLLQASRYSDVTTSRVSDDRFKRQRWDAFLYTSRLASAVGVWPWTDVFMSSERDNLLIATLSAGMVGFGDKIGSENKENLLQAARADGVLVKPDAALVPADSVYLAPQSRPMLAWTHTDHGHRRTLYLFAYARDPHDLLVRCRPADFGLSGPVCVVDPAADRGCFQDAAQPVEISTSVDSGAYRIVVPAGPSGIALVGAAGQFVPDGKKRIPLLEGHGDSTRAVILFSAGESSLRICGFATRAPRVRALRGGVGPVAFDPSGGRFTAEVFPAEGVQQELPGGDPVRQAVIEVGPAR